MFPIQPAGLDAMRRHFVVTSRYEWMFWEMGYRRESWPVQVQKRLRVRGKPGKMFDILVSAWQATLRENTPVMFGGETCNVVVRNAAWRNRR